MMLRSDGQNPERRSAGGPGCRSPRQKSSAARPAVVRGKLGRYGRSAPGPESLCTGCKSCIGPDVAGDNHHRISGDVKTGEMFLEIITGKAGNVSGYPRCGAPSGMFRPEKPAGKVVGIYFLSTLIDILQRLLGDYLFLVSRPTNVGRRSIEEKSLIPSAM